MGTNDDVLIVGAGVSGLCCALALQEKGVPFRLFESSDGIGGRVRTDVVDGFLLDRGFQIFLTAYPEAKRILDYESLDCKPFFPGAIVRAGSEFHRLCDPFRKPSQLLETIMSRIGTVSDKLKIMSLRAGSISVPAASSTMKALMECGFSDGIVEKFFRPFFSGVFLEPELQTSSEMFDFVFKMLAQGDNVLPGGGMQAIPQQIANRLPPERIRLNCSVVQVDEQSVRLSTGETIDGSAVVLATEEPATRRLLELASPHGFSSQTCLYFSGDRAPIDEPVLVLNGDGEGIVNHFCVPSNVANTYAPSGKALMSVTLIGEHNDWDTHLVELVRNDLRAWFGSQVDQWKLLRIYRTGYALPNQRPGALADRQMEYAKARGIFVCGGHTESGSINGAMVSGRKAADAVLSKLLVNA